jgi:GNAT superfamily N-acetyltransferase
MTILYAPGRRRLNLTLRPVTPEDRDFLLEVYAGTRAEELALVPWTEEQKLAFVSMQFAAQDRHYREHYPGARFLVVCYGERAVGRLYLHRTPDEIRIIDIVLLPAERGRGIGSALLAGILAEADAASLPVSIHVERNNPALSIYARLGFEMVEDKGVYLYLVRPVRVEAARG